MVSTYAFVALFLISWFVYILHAATYRLYWSPIAKFPGPKLAALTRLYELYYEIIKGGQYTFKIGEFHKKYGKLCDNRNTVPAV